MYFSREMNLNYIMQSKQQTINYTLPQMFYRQTSVLALLLFTISVISFQIDVQYCNIYVEQIAIASDIFLL